MKESIHEKPKWEKPKLIVISSGQTSENVLWGSGEGGCPPGVDCG